MLTRDAIDEIVQHCDERVFIFVDDAQRRSQEIRSFLSKSNNLRKDITIITAARTNEWNVSSRSLSAFVTSEYELTPMSEPEVVSLLALLSKNNALGELAVLSPEERLKKLILGAGRQLLVALHEATLGRPFEDIIRDEYDGIRPIAAQKLYLTICVLNRLNIPVRAGIVSRIHGINFSDFKEKFFLPLERVVRTEYNPIIRDYTYHARHPEIAQMVFNQVLRDQQQKFTAYKECLGQLNVAFDADQEAFDQMIRGRSLLEMFPDHELVEQIYEVATKQGGSESHLSHQKAVYEMNRPNGDLIGAARLLQESITKSPGNRAVQHSICELQLRLAERSRTDLERKRYLEEAVSKSRNMIARARDSRPYVTIAKALRMRLNNLLEPEKNENEESLTSTIHQAEENIEMGFQRFPGDSFLLAEESELARRLKNSSRVLSALEEAFASNSKNGFVAVRLANCLCDSGDIPTAERTLQKALVADNSNGRVHFAYAKLLIRKDDTDKDLILAHLRKSFAPGDKNYDAQLCFAAQLYRFANFDNARDAFRDLGKVEVPFDIRTQIRYEEDVEYSGTVSQMESTYGFIVRDGAKDTVYAHVSKSNRKHWGELQIGKRVVFRLGYTMRGPAAYDIKPT